jgi:hypothetical protein
VAGCGGLLWLWVLLGLDRRTQEKEPSYTRSNNFVAFCVGLITSESWSWDTRGEEVMAERRTRRWACSCGDDSLEESSFFGVRATKWGVCAGGFGCFVSRFGEFCHFGRP